MNKSEIEIIIKIIESADDGCSHCVIPMLESLEMSFPQFHEMIKETILKWRA